MMLAYYILNVRSETDVYLNPSASSKQSKAVRLNDVGRIHEDSGHSTTLHSLTLILATYAFVLLSELPTISSESVHSRMPSMYPDRTRALGQNTIRTSPNKYVPRVLPEPK